ncbi:MAG: DUF2279 domain-containing protein [Cyclobacteriaceae bacterium]
MSKLLYLIFLGLLLRLSCLAQAVQSGVTAPDTTIVLTEKLMTDKALQATDPKSLRRFLLFTGLGYAATQIGLYSLWYREQPRQSFTFFDDGPQWKQMDKAGHAYSAYHLAQLSSQSFIRAGMDVRKSYWYGALMGKMLLLPVEIFDAYSAAYGFSWTDVGANTAGALLLPLQYEIWGETRIHPKFSFSRSGLASLRPTTLGSRLHEEVLKDYNGQTYWLSFDLHRFFPEENFPRWLNLAVGYGAENMIYGRDEQNQAVGLKPYRQFYLAPDLDLSYLRKKPLSFGNRLFNGMLYVIDLIHLPAPTLSYESGRGLRFYPLYF